MRTNQVIVVIGDRSTGKTTWMKKNLILNRSLHHRKIIVDTFDSETWEDMETFDTPDNREIKVPIVALEELYKLPRGLFRTFHKNTDLIINEIDRVMFNALIIMEDATRYVGNTLKGNIKDVIFDTKQRGIDIVLVFHSFVDVPTQLARNADVFVIFKTDEVLNRKKFTSKRIQSAFDEVNSHPDKHYSRVVQK